ncbi:unnamed protein product, partial [Discosporangium mesarthrocarpum]
HNNSEESAQEPPRDPGISNVPGLPAPADKEDGDAKKVADGRSRRQGEGLGKQRPQPPSKRPLPPVDLGTQSSLSDEFFARLGLDPSRWILIPRGEVCKFERCRFRPPHLVEPVPLLQQLGRGDDSGRGGREDRGCERAGGCSVKGVDKQVGEGGEVSQHRAGIADVFKPGGFGKENSDKLSDGKAWAGGESQEGSMATTCGRNSACDNGDARRASFVQPGAGNTNTVMLKGRAAAQVPVRHWHATCGCLLASGPFKGFPFQTDLLTKAQSHERTHTNKKGKTSQSHPGAKGRGFGSELWSEEES